MRTPQACTNVQDRPTSVPRQGHGTAPGTILILLAVSGTAVPRASVAATTLTVASMQPASPAATPPASSKTKPASTKCECGGATQRKVTKASGVPKSAPRPATTSPSLGAHPAPSPRTEPGASVSAVAYRRQTPGEPPQTVAELLESATREYRETGLARPVVLGSVVAFPYGLGDAVLTCAALRACVIDLEPGERLVTRPIAGDAVRWHIGTAPAGSDGTNTLVWVKPTDCDLSTNLVLSTDRRIYQVTLDSPACDRSSTNPRTNVPGGVTSNHVTFYFPDATMPGAAPRMTIAGTIGEAAGPGVGGDGVAPDGTPTSAAFGARRQGADTRSSEPALAGITVDVTRLNFEYRVKRDRRFPWAPAQIFDDGAHTFIKIPPEAAAHAAPALFEVHGDDADAKALLNYTVRDGFYVTDRTFQRAVLVLGQGKHERRVELENPRFGAPTVRSTAPPGGKPAGVKSGDAGQTGGRNP